RGDRPPARRPGHPLAGEVRSASIAHRSAKTGSCARSQSSSKTNRDRIVRAEELMSSDPNLSVHDTPSAGFQDLVEELRKEHLFLRHAQITDFVQSSKGEKRKVIASLIGYDSITDFRDVIQSTLSALQRDRQYTTAKLRVEEDKSKLLRLCGKLLTSPQSLYDQMNDELERAGFELRISDKASYLSAVQELRAKTNQEERIQKNCYSMNCRGTSERCAKGLQGWR